MKKLLTILAVQVMRRAARRVALFARVISCGVSLDAATMVARPSVAMGFFMANDLSHGDASRLDIFPR